MGIVPVRIPVSRTSKTWIVGGDAQTYGDGAARASRRHHGLTPEPSRNLSPFSRPDRPAATSSRLFRPPAAHHPCSTPHLSSDNPIGPASNRPVTTGKFLKRSQLETDETASAPESHPDPPLMHGGRGRPQGGGGPPGDGAVARTRGWEEWRRLAGRNSGSLSSAGAAIPIERLPPSRRARLGPTSRRRARRGGGRTFPEDGGDRRWRQRTEKLRFRGWSRGAGATRTSQIGAIARSFNRKRNTISDSGLERARERLHGG